MIRIIPNTIANPEHEITQKYYEDVNAEEIDIQPMTVEEVIEKNKEEMENCTFDKLYLF